MGLPGRSQREPFRSAETPTERHWEMVHGLEKLRSLEVPVEFFPVAVWFSWSRKDYPLVRSRPKLKLRDLANLFSSIILDELLEEEENSDLPGGSRTKTIYFFCDFRDSDKVNAAGIFGSLIAQLLEAYWPNALPDHFDQFYQNNKDKRPHEDFLKEQLLKLVKQVGRTRILVDALDECSAAARMEVLRTLLEIHQAGQVNLLITSRDEVDIKTALKDFPSMCINAAVNSQDIKLFVTEECNRNVKLQRKLKGSTKTEVISTISEKADGM
jgi:hypothetical protein